MSLAFAAIRGAYFTGIALAFRQIISFVTMLYVARLLLPSDFGTVSMVIVVVSLAQVIGDIGISAGLVRTQKNTTTVLSTCFWIALGIGIFLGVCVF
ncbi:MAG: oligosaccharide flippase family protein, partial [Burkholderiaceae bacterium]